MTGFAYNFIGTTTWFDRAKLPQKSEAATFVRIAAIPSLGLQAFPFTVRFRHSEILFSVETSTGQEKFCKAKRQPALTPRSFFTVAPLSEGAVGIGNGPTPARQVVCDISLGEG